MSSLVDKSAERRWPAEGFTRIPYWVYTDQDVFDREMERLFWGASWCFVGLSCEIPNPGDFKRSWVGTRQVVVTRDKDGVANVLENRCAHKGALVCWQDRGTAKDLICPYHQWSYDLKGNLTGVPLKRGALGKGGMPRDFDNSRHGLRKLKVHERGGVIWASYDPDVPDFESYCGPDALHYVDRLFPGRELELLGYSRQIIPCNWKMYFENLKDPYHATLLHAFFITFGLWRADSKSHSSCDGDGRHGVMVSRNEGKKTTGATKEMARFADSLEMNDKDSVTPAPEFADREVAGITLFPSVVLQQQANTLAMRHIIPKGPGQTEISWHFFGYADDTPELRRLRLRHANLMGPSGFVSVDDSEVLAQCQFGASTAGNAAAVLEMGGKETEPQDHMVTEVMIRGFYKFYRKEMGY
ncbi:aromatic ring-hydroxylating dioxygenase subunit alpha [Oceanibacterium hippocampi]|uniref:Salicylate 5-hydroxylase, large oxygenase component n=1 Tax=Oceanibacterium hippocampi TaxID=745714 RepID=A0A1Y5RBW5_9PROT|nr:aromatic ring-hydroxylating dioxygenase subunit alpha [Oceanibacterium hippocampi]SLN13038.1 Salicylate 5-hydroxylase, large oxygenase component [Oceanibacterium hippocampi]